MRTLRVVGVLAFTILSGCNSAKDSYARCQAAMASFSQDYKVVAAGYVAGKLTAQPAAFTAPVADINAALDACREAVRVDPGSKYGQDAARVLPDIERLAGLLFADRDAILKQAEMQRQQAEKAAAEAQAEALRKRISLLELHVTVTTMSDGPDADCTGRALPPYWRLYEGGTFAEDEELARARGCVPKHSTPTTAFCCPANYYEQILGHGLR